MASAKSAKAKRESSSANGTVRNAPGKTQPQPDAPPPADAPQDAPAAPSNVTPSGPQLPTSNRQPVDQWIQDPQNAKAQVFGLTTLNVSGGTQPSFRRGPAPGGKGFVVLPTAASLPPIESKFLKPGRYS